MNNTQEEEETKAESPVMALAKLVGVFVVAILLFFFLIDFWQSFFKSNKGALDAKSFLGFSVLLVLACMSQALLWGLPSAVPAALVRTPIRCIGAWFEYALRVTFVFVATVIFLMVVNIVSKSSLGFSFAGAERAIKISSEVFQALMTLDVVTVAMSPRSNGSLIAGSIFAYFLYVIQVTLYLRRLFLEEKQANILVSTFLILIVTFLLSFSFYAVFPLVDERYLLPLYQPEFWRIKSEINFFFIFRLFIIWAGFIFTIVIMNTIFPDVDHEVVEVAAPVLKSPGQHSS